MNLQRTIGFFVILGIATAVFTGKALLGNTLRNVPPVPTFTSPHINLTPFPSRFVPKLEQQPQAFPILPPHDTVFTLPTDATLPRDVNRFMPPSDTSAPPTAPKQGSPYEMQVQVFQPQEQVPQPEQTDTTNVSMPIPSPIPPTSTETSPSAILDCSQETTPDLDTAEDFETFLQGMENLKRDPCFSSQKCSNGTVSQEDDNGQCVCSDILAMLGELQCTQKQKLDSYCESNATVEGLPQTSMPNNTDTPAPSLFRGSNFAGQLISPVQILRMRLQQAYMMSYNSIYRNPRIPPQMKYLQFRALTIQYNWARNQLTMLYAGM